MSRTKYKSGDIVNVRHIGPCEVKRVCIVKGVGTEYVLKRGTEIFSVSGSEITGKKEA